MKNNQQIAPYSVGFDCGNGAVKSKITGHNQEFTISFPSYFHRVDCRCGRHTDDEGVIRYLEGPEDSQVARDLKDQLFVCGSEAAAIETYEQVVNNQIDGKVVLALPMFLAMVGKLRDENDKPVIRKRWDFRVVASIHNAPAYGDRLKQTLDGLHKAVINGEETEINIVVLDVFNEGDVFCPKNKEGRNTTILDLGNGTSLVTRFNKDGKLLPDGKKRFGHGVQELYRLIMEDPEFVQSQGFGNLDLLRRAVEESDGTKVKYGYNRHATDITKIYTRNLQKWITDYLRDALDRVDKYQQMNDRVIVVGGGACLPKLGTQFKKRQYEFSAKFAPISNCRKLHERCKNQVVAEEV